METDKQNVQTYDVTSLTSLEKLEPVRIRPAVHTRLYRFKGASSLHMGNS